MLPAVEEGAHEPLARVHLPSAPMHAAKKLGALSPFCASKSMLPRACACACLDVIRGAAAPFHVRTLVAGFAAAARRQARRSFPTASSPLAPAHPTPLPSHEKQGLLALLPVKTAVHHLGAVPARTPPRASSPLLPSSAVGRLEAMRGILRASPASALQRAQNHSLVAGKVTAREQEQGATKKSTRRRESKRWRGRGARRRGGEEARRRRARR